MKYFKNYNLTIYENLNTINFNNLIKISKILLKAKKTNNKVIFVGNNGQYGKSVFVDHGYGLQTRYAHLSKIFVKKGQDLTLGQSVGKIGNTGRSTGKHLHYEIKINDKARNPQPFLRIGKSVSKKY